MKLAILMISVFLASCASTRPGEDARGKILISNATPFLYALIQYNTDHGYFPTAAEELVPQYLRVIPSEPDVSFDEYSGHVRFVYTPSTNQSEQIKCSAKFGEREFTCAKSKQG